MKAFIPISLLLLVCYGGQANTEAAMAVQQEALLLWTAGDHEGSIEKLESMHRLFPAEPRGKAAFFHIGNLLENKGLVFARTPAEARQLLARAQAYHRKSRELPGQSPHVIEQSDRALARIGGKISNLDQIAAGKFDFRVASEKISDLEASRAAVQLLQHSLEQARGDAHEIRFLTLVHQADYVDALSSALGDAYAQLRDSRPDLFRFAYEKYVPLIESAAGEAVEFAQAALANHPDSPHLADYHLYLASAHQSLAGAQMAIRDFCEREQNEAAVENARAEVVKQLELAKAANERIVALADERMAVTQSSETPEQASWRKHKNLAQGRLADIGRMLFMFQPPPAPPEMEPQ